MHFEMYLCVLPNFTAVKGRDSQKTPVMKFGHTYEGIIMIPAMPKFIDFFHNSSSEVLDIWLY